MSEGEGTGGQMGGKLGGLGPGCQGLERHGSDRGVSLSLSPHNRRLLTDFKWRITLVMSAFAGCLRQVMRRRNRKRKT